MVFEITKQKICFRWGRCKEEDKKKNTKGNFKGHKEWYFF